MTLETSAEAHIGQEELYGPLRVPNVIREWEKGTVPVSKVLLTRPVGKQLVTYRELSDATLFRSAAQCFSFLWAMDEHNEIYLAYEEILVETEETPGELLCKEGHPRRRGFPTHPADEKKLGHPTLVGCGSARLAGELILDESDKKLHWFVNCSSGRYCKDQRPTKNQCEAVHRLFMDLIDDEVRFDDPFA